MKTKIKNFYGLSLMEMMVAISIFTICIAGFSLLFIRSMKSNTYVLEMGQNSSAVSHGMEKMVEYIREARQGDNGNYPIVSAGDNSLTIYSDYNADGVTEKLHFYLQNSQVLMEISIPTSSGATRTYSAYQSPAKIIATHIVNGVSDKLFLYYNQNYPADTTNNPLSVASGDVSLIRMVKITLKMNIDPVRTPNNIVAESFAQLRNLSDYDRAP